jgi:hypothetical protein
LGIVQYRTCAAWIFDTINMIGWTAGIFRESPRPSPASPSFIEY